MRVVLVAPPLRAFNNRRMPTGLMSLASSLREFRPADVITIVDEDRPGWSANDETISAVTHDILEKVIALKADVVGCSTDSFAQPKLRRSLGD